MKSEKLHCESELWEEKSDKLSNSECVTNRLTDGAICFKADGIVVGALGCQVYSNSVGKTSVDLLFLHTENWSGIIKRIDEGSDREVESIMAFVPMK